MHTFFIHAGQAGREVATALISYYRYNYWDSKALDEVQRIIAVDQEYVRKEDIVPLDFQRHGGNLEKKIAFYHLVSEGPGQATGKVWPKGRILAEKRIADFMRSYDAEIKSSDHFHVCHSGGGGLGCGSGPVFTDRLQEFNKSIAEEGRSAITASIFLPSHANELPIAEPNTCSTIGLHADACDGIFLFDISQSGKWGEYNGPIIGKTDSIEVVDYIAAETLIALTSFNERVHMKVPGCKNIEGSDIWTFCRWLSGMHCALIVPCYAEYPRKVFDDLTFKLLAKDLLLRRSIVEYSRERPIDRAGLFAILPSRYAPNLRLKSFSPPSFDASEINEVLPNIRDPNIWLNTYYDRYMGDRVKMLGLLVNPYIPRLFEMRDNFQNMIKKEEDLLKALSATSQAKQSDTSKFKSYIPDYHDALKKYRELLCSIYGEEYKS